MNCWMVGSSTGGLLHSGMTVPCIKATSMLGLQVNLINEAFAHQLVPDSVERVPGPNFRLAIGAEDRVVAPRSSSPRWATRSATPVLPAAVALVSRAPAGVPGAAPHRHDGIPPRDSGPWRTGCTHLEWPVHRGPSSGTLLVRGAQCQGGLAAQSPAPTPLNNPHPSIWSWSMKLIVSRLPRLSNSKIRTTVARSAWCSAACPACRSGWLATHSCTHELGLCTSSNP